MLLTFIFLKTKYRFRKIAGVIVCVAGLVMVVFSDVHSGDRSGKILAFAAFSYTSSDLLIKVVIVKVVLALLCLLLTFWLIFIIMNFDQY